MTAKTGTFVTFDGTGLFFRWWEPKSPSQKAIIYMHRGHEHSGRLQQLVDGMAMDDVWSFAYDARGHGESPGPRGYAQSFSDLVKDLDTFVTFVSQKHSIPIENISVVANSVGAVVTSTWVHDYAPRIRAMVLAAPAFKVKLYVPFALAGLRLLDKIKHPAFISSYVKSKMLTHDLDEARKYDEDPLITRDIAVNILIGLFDAGKRVVADAAAITTPTLILSAGRDFVVHLSSQKKFFQNLGSQKKEMHVDPKMFHGVMYEKGREDFYAKAKRFLNEAFLAPVDRAEMLNPGESHFSVQEYRTLQAEPNFLKKLNFQMTIWMMKKIGRLSDGIRIGLETGFDSGLSLDHVYKNRPSGQNVLGRIIDYFYLQAIGWRGIRQRKINIAKSLEAAFQTLRSQGRPIRVMDIAAGPGRYLIEKAAQYPDIQVEIRDNTVANLTEGRRMAELLGLKNVQFYQHDAFQPASYAHSIKPNIIIVSGLFELFPNNQMLINALRGINHCAEENALIIYTGQPWHPQLELIAHTLNNRDQEKWIMRRRSQAELDEIFRSAGFEKKNMEIDEFGIFTVSLAQRKQTTAQQNKTLPRRDMQLSFEIGTT